MEKLKGTDNFTSPRPRKRPRDGIGRRVTIFSGWGQSFTPTRFLPGF